MRRMTAAPRAYSITHAVWFAALLAGATGIASAAASMTAPAQAEKAATAWLALVDAGHYARSWREAALYVRQTVGESAWVASVARARAVCGPLQARRFVSAYATSYLPDSPDGHYVVIHYASRFAHKNPAAETLTLVEETPQHWRVIGYYID
jgi:Protein of unknown function (DUF4019)